MSKHYRKGWILVFLLPFLICGYILIFVRPWEIGYDNRSISRDKASSVTEAFAWTLMENRTEIAKNIVHESQWPRLEQWEEEHVAVGCDRWVKFPDEWTSSHWQENIITPDGNILNDESPWPIGSTTIYHLSLWWPCPGGDYRMDIKVDLVWIEEGWQIIDWGDVIEW